MNTSRTCDPDGDKVTLSEAGSVLLLSAEGLGFSSPSASRSPRSPPSRSQKRAPVPLQSFLSGSQRFYDIHFGGAERRQHSADKTHNKRKGNRFGDDAYSHGEAESKL